MEPITTDRESLKDRVYSTIRDAIVMGELVPGSRHSVYQLAEKLNVSRTPVREALLKLADQGMVEFQRNRGVVILATTIHDLEEVFSLRLLLEVPATFRAVRLMTPARLDELRTALDDLKETAESPEPTAKEHLERDARFHRVLLEASGNLRLVNIVDTMRDVQMVRGVWTAGTTRDLSTIWEEHSKVFRCAERGDAHGAARAMADHISGTARLLLGQEVGMHGTESTFELPWIDLFTSGIDPASGTAPASDEPPAPGADPA
ncbi:GntR family transcriptional regulator [Actinomadura roseirufa]|uniref:GntR family transcriptional regulator n=1 Tax=Actinomadura roseirufa TaxID=2094049 RepID=UPI0013F14955|nr:GntR family transcriptional regulator [Actinomadura roseirufa]